MESFWLSSTPRTAFPPLDRDLEVDVAIVGGGITGITAALLLKGAGKKVAVLESRRVAEGETGRTTAHVTAIQDMPFRTIASKFGRDGARRIARAGTMAIARVEQHVRTYGIDCDFERLPGYVFTEDRRRMSELEKESEAARDAGLDCGLVDVVPLPFETAGGIRFEHQARFHPRRYLLPLAARVNGDGSFVFEATHVSQVRDGTPCVVTTNHGTVRAQHVICATDAVTVNRFFLQTKLAPYRTYVIAVRAERELPGLFYDTEDPYHYVRTHPAERGPLLIVGGADHRVGDKTETHEGYESLQRWTEKRFGSVSVVHRWSGQVQEPVDGLPFVGRNSASSHVYVATGFSGNGMVNGTLAAMVLSDAVLERENPYARLLSATRLKPLASAKTWVEENVDFPKTLLLDRLPARTRSFEEVQPGEGKVVGLGRRKVAAFRDDEGTLHTLSPVCPHMGCHVSWNREARSWDCPCHGSRFEATGEVIHGPATRGLEAVEVDEAEGDSLREEPSHAE